MWLIQKKWEGGENKDLEMLCDRFKANEHRWFKKHLISGGKARHCVLIILVRISPAIKGYREGEGSKRALALIG